MSKVSKSFIEEGIFKKQNRNLGRYKILEDFKKNSIKAKKWAEDKSKKWKRLLSDGQKGLLRDFTRFQELNSHLEKLRGHSIEDRYIRKDVERIDRALEKAKLDHSIYI